MYGEIPSGFGFRGTQSPTGSSANSAVLAKFALLAKFAFVAVPCSDPVNPAVALTLPVTVN